MMFEPPDVQANRFISQGGEFHPLDACIGEVCVIHNPSDHHMRDWPMVLRASTLIERICEHGIGHPDPDSLAYFVRIGKGALGVHGCCSCCAPPGVMISHQGT